MKQKLILLRTKLFIWLLTKLIGSQKFSSDEDVEFLATEAEVNHLRHMSYEAIITSLCKRTTRAQLIFMYKYLASLEPHVYDKLLDYLLQTSRERERNANNKRHQTSRVRSGANSNKPNVPKGTRENLRNS